VAIKNELGIPVRYIGVGESRHDLRPFVVSDFVDAIFDSANSNGEQHSAGAEAKGKGLDFLNPIPAR